MFCKDGRTLWILPGSSHALIGWQLGNDRSVYACPCKHQSSECSLLDGSNKVDYYEECFVLQYSYISIFYTKQITIDSISQEGNKSAHLCVHKLHSCNAIDTKVTGQGLIIH